MNKKNAITLFVDELKVKMTEKFIGVKNDYLKN